MSAMPAGRQSQMQTLRVLCKRHMPRNTQQPHLRNLEVRGDGTNQHPTIFRPPELNGVEMAATGGKAKILRRVGFGLSLMERTAGLGRRTLTEACPGLGAVNGLTIHLQPVPYFAQYPLCLFRNGAIGP